jgi:Uma2 family endonuclease
MDTFATIPSEPPVATSRADGLPRRKWTIDDIEKMVEAGIVGEKERFELIDGEIVPMSPKGIWHENLKRKLNIHFARALPDDVGMATETTLRHTQHDYLEPDFIFWPETQPLLDVRARDLLLLVEVADTSASYDLGPKAKLYAERGLQEYWVVNARTLRTRVHAGPTDAGYTTQIEVPHTERLVPTLISALAVTIGDLGLTPTRD